MPKSAKYLGFLLFLWMISVAAQAQEARKYSNDFLNIGVNARFLGMGSAATALATDVSSTYWNPAGLARLDNERQLSLMHNEYFGGAANYDYGALGFKLDQNSGLGFAVIRFGVDDIPNTLNLIDPNGQVNYNNVSSFSAADYAFLLSYARQTKDEKWRIGATTKVIRRVIGDFANSWGFGFDVGIQRTVNKWQFGLVGKDITTTFNAWRFTNTDPKLREVFQQTGNEIPTNNIELTLPRLVFGAAYQTDFSKKFSVTGAFDLNINTDGRRNSIISTDRFSFDPTIGFEVAYVKAVFLRAGINNIQRVPTFDEVETTSLQPNLGIGIKLKNFSVDYAITNLGDASQAFYSNVISIRLGFDKRDAE